MKKIVQNVIFTFFFRALGPSPRLFIKTKMCDYSASTNQQPKLSLSLQTKRVLDKAGKTPRKKLEKQLPIPETAT